MSNIKVRRSIMAAASIAAIGIAMMVAIMGLPFGRVDERAFAHTYTNGTDLTVVPGFENVHLHLDAKPDNCGTIDSTATFAVGTPHTTDVCIEGVSSTYRVDAFDIKINYDEVKNDAPEIDCDEANTTCLNDNPDANDGNGNLGTGWSCSVLNTTDPSSGNATGASPGTASIQCNAALVGPDTDLQNGKLITLSATVAQTGSDPMDLVGSGVSLSDGTNSTVLNCYINIACFGATITKVADVDASKSVVGTVVAGGQATFNITITTNPGGSAWTVVDDLSDPAGGPLFTYDDAATDTANGVNATCNLLIPPANAGVESNSTNVVLCSGTGNQVVVIKANVNAADQGRSTLNCFALGVDDGDGQNAGCIPVNIAGANVTHDKQCTPDPVNVGQSITCTSTITVGGPSPTTNMVSVDTPDANLGAATGTACSGAGVVGPQGTCTWAGPNAPGVYTMQTTHLVTNSPSNRQCSNSLSTSFDGPGDPANDTETVTCLPPTVRMNKDADTNFDDEENIANTANLFLCQSGPNCWSAANPLINNGNGHLVVLERLFNQNDADGAGAFEFQVKFDHKVFDISVFHGIDLNGDGDCTDAGEIQKNETVDACYLYSTGRIPGATGIGGCSATIITENWILFGCVSKDDPNTPGIQLGPIGPDNVVATLHITPEIDMIQRLTPGQKNGVVSTILDENCEAADIFGDPLGTGQFDQLGREILLPGIVTGGLIDECTDIIVTVRILEADLDADCDVDVNDDQAIAFRYGAFFGTLYYDRWFDLEPWTGDFDIDIKDLQKVFGRNGSTCQDPIPDQDPSPTDPPPPPTLP